jgi:outer membrane lipoprotein carrier protein
MFLTLCFVLGAGATATAPLDPAAAVARVGATYRAGGDMTATFSQTYTDKLRGRTRVETGRMWVKKDGRVRWSYLDPERKDFVYDGKAAYFYEPENAQVTLFEHFKDSPVAQALQFLWGQGEVEKTFAVGPCEKDCPPPEPNVLAVQLTPKQPLPSVHHVIMRIDTAAYLVQSSTVVDPLGNKNVYAFSKAQFGAKVDDAKFDFTPPTGVSILRADADANEKETSTSRPEVRRPDVSVMKGD